MSYGDADYNSSLGYFSSESYSLSRDQSEVRQVKPAKTSLRITIPLVLAEPAQIDVDWKMGSPSPTEFECQDIVMASPTEPAHSPAPEEVQDSSAWGSSSWGTDAPQSATSKEVDDFLAWVSSTLGGDAPRPPTPKEVQDSSKWNSSSCDTDPPSRSPTQDSTTWGSSTW